MKYRLDEVFELQMGKTPSRSNRDYWEPGKHKWLAISDFSDNRKYTSLTKEMISDLAVAESGINIIPANTVVMSFKLSIGKVAITSEPIYSNEAIMAFIDKGVCGIIPEYIYYYLKGLDWNRFGNKAVMGLTLNKKTLSSIEIDIPSVDEQRIIVEKLSRIESLFDGLSEQLGLMEKLIKSRFVEMFGDPIINNFGLPEARIGDNCFVTKLAGFEYSNYIQYEDSGDVVMVKAQNVKNGALNRKDLSYISNEVSDSLPRSQLAPGDVVMTYVGANIGDVAIIDNCYKYHLAPNVAKLRPDKDVYNSLYFMYMLMMKTDYIMRNSADTAKAALGMERIRKLAVLIPPLDMQNLFADYVEQVDKSKSVVQKALDETQLLFDSLMQEYFG